MKEGKKEEEEKKVEGEKEAKKEEEKKSEEKKAWARLKTTNEEMFETMVLIEDSYTFGRRSENSVQLADNKVSSFHCEIKKEKDEEGKWKVHLKDTSSNGTFVNGKKVQGAKCVGRERECGNIGSGRRGRDHHVKNSESEIRGSGLHVHLAGRSEPHQCQRYNRQRGRQESGQTSGQVSGRASGRGEEERCTEAR